MPKEKDLKRLIRARMDKTGEAYTAARAHILAKRSPPVSEYPELAGMSDAAVERKTGKDWRGWVRVLDDIEAITLTHRDIARYVFEHFDVSMWWAQSITGGYERIRGLRARGQRRDKGEPGLYEISKSKTFPVGVHTLYRAFSTKRVRLQWLPEPDLTVRSSRTNRSMRMAWPDGTQVNAHFIDKSAHKSAVQVMHTKLPTAEAGEALRTFWGERLQALATHLAD